MSAQKTVVVIQARRGSTRLPDKVLMPILGKSLLERMVERVQMARTPFTIVLATTTQAEDDVIAALAEKNGWNLYRGHPTDLLDRHYQAAKLFGAEHVAKIPSDVPLIDPRVIDKVFEFYFETAGQYDFVSNLHPPSWPDGNDVEIMPFSVLEAAWKEADKPHEREHTTPYIWDQPERFRLGNVIWENPQDYSMSHRFTIDYEEDYRFILRIFEELYPGNPQFSVEEILELLEKHPDIYLLNAAYAGVNWYRNHIGELKTISENQTKKI